MKEAVVTRLTEVLGRDRGDDQVSTDAPRAIAFHTAQQESGQTEEGGLVARLGTRPVVITLILFALCVLSYGLLITKLGFYSEDWPEMWVSRALGASGLREYLSGDRPVLGWCYSMIAPVVGDSPYRWHLLALATRWLGAVAAAWLLWGLWPRRFYEASCVALLFATYPGFSYQPVAWTFPQDLFIPLSVFMLSLGATVWARRGLSHHFWSLNALALASSTFSIWAIEYFVGLELLRPVLLWTIASDKFRSRAERLKYAFVNWLPHLLSLVIYLYWRLLVFRPKWGRQDQASALASFASRPIAWLVERVRSGFTDIIESTLMSWAQTLQPESMASASLSTWVAWSLVLFGGVCTYFCLSRLTSRAQSEDVPGGKTELGWRREATIIGLLAFIAGLLPIWFSGREIRLDDFSNRYTLTPMLGSCILALILVKTIVSTRRKQTIVISILVGLAVGFHFRNANRFRLDWEVQRSLFWQLSWRLPGLKHGTSILIDQAALPQHRNYQSALNLIYAPNNSSARLSYWFYDLSRELGTRVPRLEEGVLLELVDRNLSFSGSTSQSLAVWFSQPGCVRILDPTRDELPQLSPLARAASEISHVDQVVLSPESRAVPPSEVFGGEPPRCWCYYFEKADLARQESDWAQVALLGDEARKEDFRPADVTEWLPFIEGYVEVGRYDEAREIANLVLEAQANGLNGITKSSFDYLWKRLAEKKSGDAARARFIAETKAHLSQSAPALVSVKNPDD